METWNSRQEQEKGAKNIRLSHKPLYNYLESLGYSLGASGNGNFTGEIQFYTEEEYIDGTWQGRFFEINYKNRTFVSETGVPEVDQYIINYYTKQGLKHVPLTSDWK